MGKNATFKWIERCEKVLMTIKQKFTCSPMLTCTGHLEVTVATSDPVRLESQTENITNWRLAPDQISQQRVKRAVKMIMTIARHGSYKVIAFTSPTNMTAVKVHQK